MSRGLGDVYKRQQIQFAVWKGRNGLRGKEAPRTAGTRSVVVISDVPPTAPSFASCRKRWGRKGALGYDLVRAASDFRQVPMFSSVVPLGGHPTSFCYAPPDTGEPDLQLVALERLLSIEGADEIRIDVTFLRGKAPLEGELSPKVTERLLHICGDLSVSASPSHLPWKGRLGNCALQWLPL